MHGVCGNVRGFRSPRYRHIAPSIEIWQIHGLSHAKVEIFNKKPGNKRRKRIAHLQVAAQLRLRESSNAARAHERGRVLGGKLDVLNVGI